MGRLLQKKVPPTQKHGALFHRTFVTGSQRGTLSPARPVRRITHIPGAPAERPFVHPRSPPHTHRSPEPPGEPLDGATVPPASALCPTTRGPREPGSLQNAVSGSPGATHPPARDSPSRPGKSHGTGLPRPPTSLAPLWLKHHSRSGDPGTGPKATPNRASATPRPPPAKEIARENEIKLPARLDRPRGAHAFLPEPRGRREPAKPRSGGLEFSRSRECVEHSSAALKTKNE